MKNKLILGLVVLSLVLVGGYAVLSNRNTVKAPVTTNENLTETTESSMPSLSEIEGKSVISIKDYTFSPKSLTVKPGETVYVTNSDVVIHTVTSDEGIFDSGLVGTDEVKSFTAPTTAGTYSYHCTPHPNMKGTLVVAE